MSLLPVGSTDWQTERAFQLMEQGQPDGALEIFEGIFRSRDPQTHPYAMGAMCLAKAYGQAGDSAMEERYLILAATMDIPGILLYLLCAERCQFLQFPFQEHRDRAPLSDHREQLPL